MKVEYVSGFPLDSYCGTRNLLCFLLTVFQDRRLLDRPRLPSLRLLAEDSIGAGAFLICIAAVIENREYAARTYDNGRTGIVYLGIQDNTQSTPTKYTNPRAGTRIGRVAAASVFLRHCTNKTTGVKRYEGTRLGRQEINGELLEDLPGALWTRARIDALRAAKAPELIRVVVAVDPAAGSAETSSETGIVVAGLGADGHGYVLDDASLRGTPDAWGRAAVAAYRRWSADRIIGEVNHGGEMVEHVIRTVDAAVSYKAVRASRGKVRRAEPVAALDEQGRVHHVGAFPELEDQMCAMTAGFERASAGFSPDRVDARVWALSELMLGELPGEPRLRAL